LFFIRNRIKKWIYFAVFLIIGAITCFFLNQILFFLESIGMVILAFISEKIIPDSSIYLILMIPYVFNFLAIKISITIWIFEIITKKNFNTEKKNNHNTSILKKTF
jgi:hypothetical protein